MKRELNKLANTEYDVIIVGAGIYGVNAAWDATLRGLKVALIDKDDFGNATSANSLKIIHGGLRYLQQLDIKRMRESIYERMVLMRIAPHLVYPMQVAMPTYSYKMKSRPALMAALLANDIVGFDRNKLDDPHKFMPQGFTISKKKVQDYIPGYEKYNMNGGAVWYDCQCYNTERLLLSFVISAANKGADIANYVKASRLIVEGNKVIGIKVQDTITGDKFDIRAKIVINNTGPWVDNLINNSNTKKFNLSSAMNLVVKRKLLNCSAGLSGPYKYVHKDGSEYNAFRMLFFASWRDYTIIGTNHLTYKGATPEHYKVTESEIQAFLKDVNEAYPGANITRKEVTYFYGGFLPMASQDPATGEVNLTKHYTLHNHVNDDKLDGLISVIGVKYTTARDVARKTIDMVFRKMNAKSPDCMTEETPIYGGKIERFEEFQRELIAEKPYGLSDSTLNHLSYNYGSDCETIMDYGKVDKSLMSTLPESNEVIKAEIVHAVTQEMALKLSDVVQRRTDLGTGENPGQKNLETAAQIMAEKLGWNDDRIRQEIEETNEIYIPANE